jgi:hypothetical protein
MWGCVLVYVSKCTTNIQTVRYSGMLVGFEERERKKLCKHTCKRKYYAFYNVFRSAKCIRIEMQETQHMYLPQYGVLGFKKTSTSLM